MLSLKRSRKNTGRMVLKRGAALHIFLRGSPEAIRTVRPASKFCKTPHRAGVKDHSIKVHIRIPSETVIFVFPHQNEGAEAGQDWEDEKMFLIHRIGLVWLRHWERPWWEDNNTGHISYAQNVFYAPMTASVQINERFRLLHPDLEIWDPLSPSPV